MKTVRGVYDGQRVLLSEDVEAAPQTEVLVTFLAPQRQPEGTFDLEDLIGCVGYKGPRKPLEEMEDGVREGAEARSQ